MLAGINQDWPSMWLDKFNGVPSTQFCKIQGALFQLFASAEVLLWLEITITLWFVLVRECFLIHKNFVLPIGYTIKIFITLNLTYIHLFMELFFFFSLFFFYKLTQFTIKLE